MKAENEKSILNMHELFERFAENIVYFLIVFVSFSYEHYAQRELTCYTVKTVYYTHSFELSVFKLTVFNLINFRVVKCRL